jgi:integrase
MPGQKRATSPAERDPTNAPSMAAAATGTARRSERGSVVRITAHQFRHAAGVIILQEQPGNYELVRQILGHRSLSTTIRCYIWLKNIQALQIYQKIVRKRLKIDPEHDNEQ